MKKLSTTVKFALDMLPLGVFFALYKQMGLFEATTGLIIATILAIAIIYVYERKIALAPLITGIVVSVFGGLTLYLHNEMFIKIKPTLINLVFAAILLGGCAVKKGLLKKVLSGAFSLTDYGWFLLSRRWGFFFLFMAALNEYVWRNYPTETWVNFKVFGLLGMTMIFAVAQVSFLAKHEKKID